MIAASDYSLDKLQNGAHPVKYKASALPGSPAPRPDAHSHDGTSTHTTSASTHSNSSANSSANSAANLSAMSRSAVAHSAKLAAAAASRPPPTHAPRSGASSAAAA